jgi:single-strand DNA-binding protein
VVSVAETSGRAPKMTVDGRLRQGTTVNNVNLIGSVVNAPELSFDAGGRPVCALQLAVQRRGPTGEPEPGVIYVDVTAYERLARTCAEHVAEGQRVGVAGRLERDDSLDQRGPRRSRWEVHAYQLDLLDAVLPRHD